MAGWRSSASTRLVRPARCSVLPGFFGADEALTDRAPGATTWVATLITTGGDVAAARARGARAIQGLALADGLELQPESDPGRAGRGEQVTRLSAHHVSDPEQRLRQLDHGLREVAGLDLRALALRAAGLAPADDPFAGARVAAVPITSGEGLITGFCQGVAAILQHLGCDALVTESVDMRGIQEAMQVGAEVLFLADDARFVALNVRRARCIDNDLATADGYAAALAAAAGGLRGRAVLILGLGPIGRAAARRLHEGGADVHVVETDAARLQAALASALRASPGLPRGRAAALRSDLRRHSRPGHHPRRGHQFLDDRRRPRHPVGVHGSSAGGPRRAPYPRPSGHRRRGHGRARPELNGSRRSRPTPLRRPDVVGWTLRGGSIGRISAGSKPTQAGVTPALPAILSRSRPYRVKVTGIRTSSWREPSSID